MGGDGCCSLAILQEGEVSAMIGGPPSMSGGPLKAYCCQKLSKKIAPNAINGQISTVKIGCLSITAGCTPRCAVLGGVMVMAQLLANIAPPTELRPSLTRGN